MAVLPGSAAKTEAWPRRLRHTPAAEIKMNAKEQSRQSPFEFGLYFWGETCLCKDPCYVCVVRLCFKGATDMHNWQLTESGEPSGPTEAAQTQEPAWLSGGPSKLHFSPLISIFSLSNPGDLKPFLNNRKTIVRTNHLRFMMILAILRSSMRSPIRRCWSCVGRPSDVFFWSGTSCFYLCWISFLCF